MIKLVVDKALLCAYIVIAMRKLKLKVDADGNKTPKSMESRPCKVMKTRYAKPFESVQVEIYETGMSPYSGLTEFFEAKGALKKQEQDLNIPSVTGEVITQFVKYGISNDNG